ncbi:MAG: IS4 family transposase [Paludibacter sp.]
MLRHKDTIILSEINSFFTSSEKAMETIFSFIRSLTFSDKKLGFSKANNLKFSNHNKLVLLLLFPFFEIKSSWHYADSALYRFLSCGKDIFYRLMNDSSIDWRNLSYSINMQLIRKAQNNSELSNSNPRCLIIDDTDLPKTGRKIELIGKIFSHVRHTSNLGFKGLFMGYHDGKSFFSLDFSLHGEKGKNQNRPYGLTPAQAKKRYSKKRDKTSKAIERTNDYFLTKIESMINMIRLAIAKGIRFDYLLVDSWFTCFELVKFIVSRRIKCHFIGMIKMGKTRYDAFGKNLTSKEIVDLIRRKRMTKRSKLLGYYYAETIVDFKGIQVKLFFCKSSKKGNWNGMMTTNMELTFEQAYKIYSTRWSVEVFFKESKQHLGLGKCQAQDFDAQIAATSLCMLQYNLLSVVKRFNDYETLGELFRASQKDALKLTISEQIWLIIIEVIAELSEIFNVNTEMLMEKLFSENEKITKYLNFKNLPQAG